MGTVTTMTLRHRDGNWTNYLPAQLLEICEQPCENLLWWPCPLLDHDPDYSFCTGWGELVCHQYTVTWTHHAHSLTKETNKKLKGKQVLKVGQCNFLQFGGWTDLNRIFTAIRHNIIPPAGEVNNADCFFILAPINMWDIFRCQENILSWKLMD